MVIGLRAKYFRTSSSETTRALAEAFAADAALLASAADDDDDEEFCWCDVGALCLFVFTAAMIAAVLLDLDRPTVAGGAGWDEDAAEEEEDSSWTWNELFRFGFLLLLFPWGTGSVAFLFLFSPFWLLLFFDFFKTKIQNFWDSWHNFFMQNTYIFIFEI